MATSNNNNFKKLQDLWYGKLKDSGFKDIENANGNLKESATNVFTRDRAAVQYGGLEAKAEYYRLAGFFLEEHKFETEMDKVIWEYHANGLSCSNIADTLNKAKVMKTNRTSIGLIVKKLKDKMFETYLARK